mmetsp:Transcript_21357/g.30577  ORF Transcript_21357/g.30577 Transcript_21357/m.30577 type:complete len:141 (+) Transcript_21357:5950-6372(+)
MIHTSAHYLFDQAPDALLRKTRQYLLCWVRSVEVAITHQETETNTLSEQAARFFGEPSSFGMPHLGAEQTLHSRVHDLWEADISSPVSYNLRHRRRGNVIDILDEASDESIIPPAMLEEPCDSSYTLSAQTDVPLRVDSP